MLLMNQRPDPSLDEPAPRKPSECPVEDWLAFLGHRWNALLLWHLASAPQGHTQLLTLLSGISSKVLSERLSALLGRGLIEKSSRPTFPRTVRYSLSSQGIEVVAILHRIERWTKTAPPNL